jgi:hypothetical protein
MPRAEALERLSESLLRRAARVTPCGRDLGYADRQHGEGRCSRGPHAPQPRRIPAPAIRAPTADAHVIRIDDVGGCSLRRVEHRRWNEPSLTDFASCIRRQRCHARSYVPLTSLVYAAVGLARSGGEAVARYDGPVPIAYERDDSRRVISVKVTAPYAVDDIIDAIDRQAAEDTWAYAMLYDLRAVDVSTDDDAQRLAAHAKVAGKGRIRGPVGTRSLHSPNTSAERIHTRPCSGMWKSCSTRRNWTSGWSATRHGGRSNPRIRSPLPLVLDHFASPVEGTSRWFR